MFIEFNAEGLGKRHCLFVGLKSDGKHHHIKSLFNQFSIRLCITQYEVTRARLFTHCRYHGPLIPDRIFLFSAINVFVEVFPEGTDIHIENGGLNARVMFLCDYRLFGRIHTANRRAPGVGIVGIPGTDALDPCDFFRVLAISGSHDLSHERAGGGENSFKLNG